MCGIAGFAGEDQAKIERMVQCLKHRGPDNQAAWVGSGASVGNARLAIIDPRPEGNQPLWNDDRTVVITFNGEIYNHRELREQEGLRCRTNTDTEVVLRLYEKHGMKFVSKLRGMFAFGIYDLRSHTWNLARDANGILPLFIALPNGQLHFASEMRTLLCAMPSKPTISYTSLSLFMRLHYVPGPQTMCEGIESLPPGTVFTWKDGKSQRTTFSADCMELHYASRDEFKESIIDVIDNAVKAHLLSDKPVGIFLSGGMDSSIVLHHMQNHAKKPVKTYTVRFEATEEEGSKRFNTDAELAAMTAKHYGTDHKELVLTAADYREHYRETACALDQPNADAVSVAQFLLARMAKKEVDVVLCGAGGDELFGGYPRYRVARVLRALRHVPPALRSITGRALGYPGDVLAMRPGPVLAERLLARPRHEIDRVVRGNWFSSEETTTLFAERFAALHIKDPVRAFMEFDRHLWLVDESLRLADAVTLGNGLECRPPLIDPIVVAAAQGVPAHWHITLKRTKALLKDAYRGILPEHLYTLPKASFYPPLAKWLRREAEPLVHDALENTHIKKLFDVDAVRTVLTEHKQKTKYQLHTLSAITQLGHWFETVYEA